MVVAAGVTVWLGVKAEGKTLEELSAPQGSARRPRAPAPPPWAIARHPAEA